MQVNATINQKRFKCGICQDSMLKKYEIGGMKFHSKHICNKCRKTFSEEDLVFVLNLFIAYGGYFNKYPREYFSIKEEIYKLGEKLKQMQKKPNYLKINIKLIHDALLHGITLEEIYSIMELMKINRLGV
ncbi:MAG: hypothetical protein GF317_14725 [Candidatus Lokiarchaeota archaeon]|nr:hypothetical protein [Candidatus Lokiarchaeota archaeon]MBD3200862.1 hypothetical protein [Candidatus Lokiarchaeota archaeon]